MPTKYLAIATLMGVAIGFAIVSPDWEINTTLTVGIIIAGIVIIGGIGGIILLNRRDIRPNNPPAITAYCEVIESNPGRQSIPYTLTRIGPGNPTHIRPAEPPQSR
jgi:hypothetical protein